MVRSDVNIMKLEILDFVFLLTAYADDTTFLVADLDSIKLIFVNFDKFTIFQVRIGWYRCKAKCANGTLWHKKHSILQRIC